MDSVPLSANATCNSGSGGTLVDIASIPIGGKVEYVYSAIPNPHRPAMRSPTPLRQA